jgi:hypothetical protein
MRAYEGDQLVAEATSPSSYFCAYGLVASATSLIYSPAWRPFWREAGHRDFFDGCIRDERQCRRAYKYTLTQSDRHGIAKDDRHYPHTHVSIDLKRGLKRALELQAFLEKESYKRYQKPRSTGH